MEPDHSQHPYTVLFDEREESWYVTRGSAQHIPLSRASLQHLICLYNEIHRATPLALIERRALQQLGEERRDLQDTLCSLYDYIDGAAGRSRVTIRRGPTLARALLRCFRLLSVVRNWIHQALGGSR